MSEAIEWTNDLERPIFVWIEPLGIPVKLAHDECLRIEFTCKRSELRSIEFGVHHYLSFPPECQPQAVIQSSMQVVNVDLPSIPRQSLDDDAYGACKFRRMIDYLATSMTSTSDPQFAEDCSEALHKIGTADAIDAMFCAYHDVQQSIAVTLQPRIIYWLNLCKYDTPASRGVGLKHLDFIYSVITKAPNTPPESCRRAFYLLSKLHVQSPETLNLIVALIERIADLTDHEWKVTRDAAILFIEKRSKGLIRGNVNLRKALHGSDSLDPSRSCQICQYFFARPKESGDICPDCKFEFGVDDAAHYKKKTHNDT